jgi:hypothetical protein
MACIMELVYLSSRQVIFIWGIGLIIDKMVKVKCYKKMDPYMKVNLRMD